MVTYNFSSCRREQLVQLGDELSQEEQECAKLALNSSDEAQSKKHYSNAAELRDHIGMLNYEVIKNLPCSKCLARTFCTIRRSRRERS
ncbi:MAG TPA: hypothetical protein VI819_02975 [Patescibacteria group bacterium]|nr:hypothetical protein [Patescibacteria group bacterium]